jgi:hypothetical protein
MKHREVNSVVRAEIIVLALNDHSFALKAVADRKPHKATLNPQPKKAISQYMKIAAPQRNE